YCRGGGHGRAYEVCPAIATLSPLEIAVARRCATLSRLQYVRVHSQTHRTTRLAPFETCVDKNAIDAALFGFALYCLRTGNDHRLHAACYSISFYHTRR